MSTSISRYILLLSFIFSTTLFFNSCKKESIEKIPQNTPILYDFHDEDALGYKTRSKWNKTDLTWYVEKIGNSLTKQEIEDILEKAFGIWSSVSPLKFTKVNTISSADIVISFGDNQHSTKVTNTWCPEDFKVTKKNQGTLAHAYYPSSDPLSGDLHFCDLHNWTHFGDASSISLLSVAIHEIGHAIGIDHSTDAKAIMYEYYMPQDIKYALSQDDIKAVQSLYGSSGGTKESIIRISGNNNGEVVVGKNQDFEIQVNNDGDKDLTITAINLANNIHNAYVFYNGIPNLPIIIKGGGKIDLELRFSPKNVQQYKADIIITSDASSGKGEIALSYSGKTDNANTSIIRLTAGSCPDVTLGQSGNFNLSVYNDGNSSFNISKITSTDPAFSVQNFNSTSIDANTSKTFSFKFSPTQAKLYSTSIVVQSDAVSGINTIIVYGTGVLSTNSKITVEPKIGTYTACNNNNSTRDLTNYNKWLHTDYITNKYKLKVVSIDSANGIINFNVKRCDNYNFDKSYSIEIYEINPNYSTPKVLAKSNDPDVNIKLFTKFEGHNKKTYVAIITDSSLGGDYFCTQDIEISW